MMAPLDQAFKAVVAISTLRKSLSASSFPFFQLPSLLLQPLLASLCYLKIPG
jgi:hypothetical protein